LQDELGQMHEYRIVGPDEFDHASKYISMDAPLAKALLKRRLYDEISVQLPAGKCIYTIIKIRY
jgi:transcription elongation factor GreB